MSEREFILRLKADSSKAVKSISTIEQSLVKLNKQRAEYTKLLKKSNGDDKAAALGLAKVNAEINKQKKARLENQKVLRSQVALMAAEKGSMNAIAHELSVNVRRYKAMSSAEREGTKTGKNLAKTIRKQELALQKLDSALGRSQRRVGNYAGAMRNVAASLAGAFGVTLGLQAFTRVLTDSIKTVAQFEKNLSSLSAITGVTGDDLEYFGERALITSSRVTLTATDIVAAYERIGSIRPELLKNSKALTDVTEDAIILSEATGGKLALEDAARATAVTLNQFRLESSKSIDVVNALAAGSKFGSSGVVELADGFDKFGSIAQTLNITVEQSVGLLETLAEQNLVGAEAGTKLRNVLLVLQQDSRNWNNGIFDLNTALMNLANETSGLTDLTDRFGKRNVVAANILVENRKTVLEYTDAVTGTTTAIEQQAIQNNNLAGSTKFLASAWEAYILSFKNGTGILKDATDALTDMLNTMSGQKAISKAEEGANRIFKSWEKQGLLTADFIKGQLKTVIDQVEELNKSKLEILEENKWADIQLRFLGMETSGDKLNQQIEDRLVLVDKLKEKLKELDTPTPKGGTDTTKEDKALIEKVNANILNQIEKQIEAEDELTDQQFERNRKKLEKKNEEDLKNIEDQNERIKELRDKIAEENASTEQEKEELQIEHDFEKQEAELEKIVNDAEVKKELLKLLEEEKEIELAKVRDKYLKKNIATQDKANKTEIRMRAKATRELENIARALGRAILGISNDTIAGRLINIGVDAAIQAATVIISTKAAQSRNLAQATASAPPPLNVPFIAAAVAQNVALDVSSKKSIGTILASAAVGALGAVSKAENGWFLVGNSHAQGGIRLSPNVEGEGGEYISTKRTMANPQLREIILAADDAGKNGKNLNVGVSEERIAEIAAGVVASIPVTLLESKMTDLQREVALRESKFKR